MTRIEKRLVDLKAKNETAFVAFVMAGDPNLEISAELIQKLPGAGVDILEIGMPFTDPMADGPTIQLAGQRALEAGMNLQKTLELVKNFRQADPETPIVLMGYYNPIYAMGVAEFLKSAQDVGVDGLIVVDLPPEEDSELCIPAQNAGLNFIRLTTPTTDDERLPAVAKNTSGFVYYVSITGITGAGSAQASDIAPQIERIRAATQLPVCAGFGVKTPEKATEIGKVADGVVVGSAIIEELAKGKSVDEVLTFVESLSQAAKSE